MIYVWGNYENKDNFIGFIFVCNLRKMYLFIRFDKLLIWDVIKY